MNDQSENTNIDLNYIVFKGKIMNFQNSYDYDIEKFLLNEETDEIKNKDIFEINLFKLNFKKYMCKCTLI